MCFTARSELWDAKQRKAAVSLKESNMQELDHTSLKWIWSIAVIPITWFFRLVWTNHKSLNELRVELSRTPTYEDIEKCKEDERQHIIDVVKPLQDGHIRIESKLDKLIDRELNRK